MGPGGPSKASALTALRVPPPLGVYGTRYKEPGSGPSAAGEDRSLMGCDVIKHGCSFSL